MNILQQYTNLQRYNKVIRIAGVLLAVWLVGCASSEPYRYAGAEAGEDSAAAETQTEASVAGAAAAREEAAAEERRQAEMAAAERAKREEALARQQAAERQAAEAEKAQRLAQQQAAQEQIEKEVAAQRERIAALQSQIKTLDDETGQLDEANALLEEALAAAEVLNQALSEEQSKYEALDPETGEPVTPLDRDGIATLREQKERLEAEAQALMVDSSDGL